MLSEDFTVVLNCRAYQQNYQNPGLQKEERK